MDNFKNKTNNSWYPYEELGNFFKLEKSILIGCPMNIDGTRDNTPYDVDWERGVDEKDKIKMNEVVSELQKKD